VFKLPRGTRDFAPVEMEKRRYIEENMVSTFKSFGYEEIQTPTFEMLELFTEKSGDAIIDEIYTFTDKGGRQLALRPELTAPVIRFYTDKLQMEPKPLKLFYFGNCYRYDRPQKGRYREFRQAGCELIGADTPEAYAELVALAYSLLKNVGLKNIQLNIGNLTIIHALFDQLDLSINDQKQLLPLIDKAQFDDVYSFLQDINIPNESITTFIDILQTSDIKKIKALFQDNSSIVDEVSYMEKILNLLHTAFQINDFQITLSIVRGLDYYKGLVFEIDAPTLGAEKQICGGGAYELVSVFGGTETPTAGFAIGFDRIILALELEKFIFPLIKTEIHIIPVTKDMIHKSIEIAQNLRNEGIQTNIDLLQRGVGKSLKYAHVKHAEKVIIIGPKDLEHDSVTIRDMKDGNQAIVKITDIISTLKTNR
jgi:histidyl-tRNA synthetase